MIFSACHLDINTVDPQASESIKASKDASLFIQQYVMVGGSDSVLSIGEIWVEKGWRYTIVGNKVVKKQAGGPQLVFKRLGFKNSSLREDGFASAWNMHLEDDMVVAQNGDIYSFELKNSALRTEYNIVIDERKDGTINTIDSFKVVAKY